MAKASAMQAWWQHFPETINPIAFTVGFFSVHWYAMFFLMGFIAIFLFAFWLERKGEAPCTSEDAFDLLIFLFFAALIGARIGYVLLYHLDVFWAAPLAIVSPYDFSRGVWTGLSGMSYHGGVVGVIIALYWFARKRNIPFWKIADFAALLAPAAIFFGRLGNFMNGELPGRITTKPWGMIFPNISPVGVLRHPSTLYEAFFEGVILFALLLLLRRRVRFDGALSCFYLGLYAVIRFGMEYFREPDPQLGFFFGLFSLGQILSFLMLCSSVVIFAWLKQENRAKM